MIRTTLLTLAIAFTAVACNFNSGKEGGPCKYADQPTKIYSADTAIYLTHTPAQMHPWLANGLLKDITELMNPGDAEYVHTMGGDTLEGNIQVIESGSCTPISISVTREPVESTTTTDTISE